MAVQPTSHFPFGFRIPDLVTIRSHRSELPNARGLATSIAKPVTCYTQWLQIRLFDIHIQAPTFTGNHTNPLFWRVLLTDLHNFGTHTSVTRHSRTALTHENSYRQPYTSQQVLHSTLGLHSFQIVRLPKGPNIPYSSSLLKEISNYYACNSEMTLTSSALTQRHVMKPLYWKSIDEGALGRWHVILTGQSNHDVT